MFKEYKKACTPSFKWNKFTKTDMQITAEQLNIISLYSGGTPLHLSPEEKQELKERIQTAIDKVGRVQR